MSEKMRFLYFKGLGMSRPTLRKTFFVSAISWLLLSMAGCSTLNTNPAPPAFTKLQRTQAPAYYRLALGEFRVTALSDGTVSLPLDRMLANISPEEVRQMLATNFETLPAETSINAFLIDTGSRRLLVDAGAGTLFGKDGGQLIANLSAAGYEAKDIDAVLLTHLHGDHSGGLVVDGQRLFPNATVYLSKADREYRFNVQAEAAAPSHQKAMFPESRASLTPYEQAGKVVLFEAGAQLFPGVGTIAAPGHTPGHTLYVVESKGEKIVFSGDLVHAAAVQLPRPEVTISFDADAFAAAADRKTLFARLASDRILLAAAHISFPGIGHLRATGSGYQWVPVVYSLTGC